MKNNLLNKATAGIWLFLRLAGITATAAYCLYVLFYILFGKEHPDFFASSIFQRISAASLSVIFTALAASSFRLVSEKLRTPFLIGILCITALFMQFFIPYCPANDCYDLTFFLEMALDKSTNQYQTAYLSGYVTNRLVVLLYYPIVRLLNDIGLGVRITNFLFTLISMLSLFFACRRMFGKSASEASAFVLIIFFPFMLLVGPYIYLPSITLSALALFLYNGDKLWEKLCSFLVGGILFAIRPVACGFFLVYIAVDGLLTSYKKFMILKNIGKTATALLCFFIIQSAIGAALYHSGLHPYPKMDSLATLWTIEVGTRPKGHATGLCTYTPYDDREGDEISDKFHEIWNLYSKGKGELFEEITELKAQTSAMIGERIKNTILKDFPSAADYVSAKFANYYNDVYKPYYYSANLTSPQFGYGVYMNYNKRYFLFLNTFITVFSLVAIFALIMAFIRLLKDKVSKNLCRCCVLALGAILVSIAAILLTEVGKRLIFDVTVPMLAVISYGIAVISNKSEVLPKKAMPILPAAALVSFGVLQLIYNQFNIVPFKDCTVTLTDTEIILNFSEPLPDGYVIIDRYGTEYPVGGKASVSFLNEENRGDYLYLRLPDGSEYGFDKVKPAR